jgi:hypothetical protein
MVCVVVNICVMDNDIWAQPPLAEAHTLVVYDYNNALWGQAHSATCAPHIHSTAQP